MNKFYITAAIPYVNAPPHVGHALEFIQADVIARSHRQKGEEVLLLSGSDENAIKNVQAAEQAGVSVEDFINKNTKLFSDLSGVLGVQLDVFQKGSNPDHHTSSQKLWQLCDKAGDIYKTSYKGLYCVGCETFYTLVELNKKQECHEHLGKKLETISEENYFFKLSKYQKQLIALIEKDEFKIIPASRKNEVLSFLKEPLEDISISRTNERAKNWGVPVPGDDSQRIYVWFDALNIYQSGVGFGLNEKEYKKWWPADLHVIGKGIIRFHAIYWPAFLLSAGLPLPKSIFVHGYITVDGQKMSKSLGNVIDPVELVEKYGVDAVRYFFLREIPAYDDGDFSYEKFETRYNADLAGGLGNLVSRVLAMAEKEGIKEPKSIKNSELKKTIKIVKEDVDSALEDFKFHEALESVWSLIHDADRLIEKERPWEESDNQKEVIGDLLFVVSHVAKFLEPFLPETSEKIIHQLQKGKGDSLFPRLS
ncbi:MAG: methionine--tRNA ligase [Patescibacteria group bacterium]|nr:methionine--tRNA ligase [Patescibacteria group bacterium]